MLTFNIIILAVATVILARVLSTLLVGATDFIAQIGGSIHKRMHITDGAQPDVWLFSLLLGITKIPLIACGSVWFFALVLTHIVDMPWISVALLLARSLFLFLFGLRLISALVASYVFGSEVHTILKSLQS